MTLRAQISGAIIALTLMSLVQVAQLSAQAPVAPPNANVPLFFMRPPEVPSGVQGHPFHATVTADWKLTQPGGKELSFEAKGSVWRDSEGNVRVEATTTRSGGAPVQRPTIDDVFLAAQMTMLSWNSASANARSIRLSNLDASNHLFENLATPAAFEMARTSETNCRQVGVACVTEPLGVRVIEGTRVNGTRYKETIPAALVGAESDVTVTRDVWTDPEKNVVMEIDGDDPLFGNFKMRLSEVTVGEPSKDLFEIPEGHKVSDITPPGRLPEPFHLSNP